MNPVKALMVREPLDYEYSSYGSFVNRDSTADTKNNSKVKNLISELTDTSRVTEIGEI